MLFISHFFTKINHILPLGERCEKVGPCVDEPCNATYSVACSQDVSDPDPVNYNYTCACQQGKLSFEFGLLYVSLFVE